MAQWRRSVYSASHVEETLFIVAARDHIVNVDNRDLQAARDALLQVPNMNTTGRLPAVAMVHVGTHRILLILFDSIGFYVILLYSIRAEAQ